MSWTVTETLNLPAPPGTVTKKQKVMVTGLTKGEALVVREAALQTFAVMELNNQNLPKGWAPFSGGVAVDEVP